MSCLARRAPRRTGCHWRPGRPGAPGSKLGCRPHTAPAADWAVWPAWRGAIPRWPCNLALRGDSGLAVTWARSRTGASMSDSAPPPTSMQVWPGLAPAAQWSFLPSRLDPRHEYCGLQCTPSSCWLYFVRHTGGALSDTLLSKQTALALRVVHAPKAGGCAMLRQCLRGCPLASAVLFSSLAALLGSAGQANYASANAALDGEAEVLGTMVRTVHALPPASSSALGYLY